MNRVPHPILHIDGAHGEGGGQLVRTAVALAAISGRPLHMRNIRARRAKPGLAAQHLTAVRAVAALCGATVKGAAVGSGELTFVPQTVRGGDYRFDVGTAGSITLVLQALLPVLLAADRPSRVTIRGGTDVRGAPPMDYLACVLLPLLA
ncbi:MAG: rtcA, partial [Proteobacteria bacterium]|nr:rtcA [Pseudomonadota bacterium]